MSAKFTTIFGIGLLALGAACSGPAPTPAPIIYPEPVFDKYGNPDCRPPDQPIGGRYTAELPLCYVPPGDCEPGGRYASNSTICPPPPDDGEDRTPTTPGTPQPGTPATRQ